MFEHTSRGDIAESEDRILQSIKERGINSSDDLRSERSTETVDVVDGFCVDAQRDSNGSGCANGLRGRGGPGWTGTSNTAPARAT